jgi:hypothetical protein
MQLNWVDLLMFLQRDTSETNHTGYSECLIVSRISFLTTDYVLICTNP